MGIAIQDEEIKQSLIFYEEASCLKLFYSILAFFLLAIFSANIALYILFIGKEPAPNSMKQFIYFAEGFYLILLILVFRKISQYKTGFLEGLRSATIVALIASITYVFYFYIMWYKTIVLFTGGIFFRQAKSSKFTFIADLINMVFSVIMFAYIMGISQYIKGLMARRVDRFHILFIGMRIADFSCILIQLNINKANMSYQCIGLTIRLGFLIYALFQDAVLNVKYTDIDYSVLSDAALAVLNGRSPFTRITYRYSPIYSWIFLPNHLVSLHFGKFVMIFVDLLIARVLASLLNKHPHTSKFIGVGWWLNPLSFAISTRGSSDGLPILVFLLSLYLFKKSSYLLSGGLLGLAIHLKLNALIYIPTLFLSADLKSNTKKRPSLVSAVKGIFTLNKLKFGIGCCLSFVALTYLIFSLYGQQYLNEAILFHFTRLDFRHNLSFRYYSASLYSVMNPTHVHILKLFGTATQVLTVIGGGLALHWHLELALFLQTVCFFTLNQVITAQYFMWYFPLLILLLPYNNFGGSFFSRCPLLWMVWFLTYQISLISAYFLEFQGVQVFLLNWFSTIIFAMVQNFVLRRMVQETECSIVIVDE